MSIVGSVLKNLWRSKARKQKRTALLRYAGLHAFIEQRIIEDVYSEPTDEGHARITSEVLEGIDSKMDLRGKHVLDVGCGRGVALEKFAQYGAIAKGLAFGDDFEECRRRGYDVHQMDMSFLEFPEESFDLIWARHSLEHSLFPYFTLYVLASVLKHGGFFYAEVPAPDTSAYHHLNRNHYSCLTRSSWLSLFQRVGLRVLDTWDIDIELVCGPDTWYSFYLERL